MTTLFARPPLQELPMSKVQSGSRRQSARLQEKEDSVPPSSSGTTSAINSTNPTAVPKTRTSAAVSKKRKAQYDEDDDGFKFSRVKKRKESPALPTVSAQVPIPVIADVAHPATTTHHGVAASPTRQHKKRMSFSTPTKKDQQPVRRSKRLSSDAAAKTSPPPPPQASQELQPVKIRKENAAKHKPPASSHDGMPANSQVPSQQTPDGRDPHCAATKIALPFADTPVISRNKAMRQGRDSKGERRSSLGLRGRRASSLIESGTSNALPHAEVHAQDFYKHIEGDLLESRRMRQLLTWCATRSMHATPRGMTFDESSATSAARVIEEELLKDLASNSDLSDWFTRDDVRSAAAALPVRPNPKNVTNAAKITELEAQIARLKAEKSSLERMSSQSTSHARKRSSLHLGHPPTLAVTDLTIVDELQQGSLLPDQLAAKVNDITTRLQSTVDTFSDGVHCIQQYRQLADTVASQALAMCSTKLIERDKLERQQALASDQPETPGRSLSGVLRGLSKTAR